MIIYPDQGAGMCNRLHAVANLIAHSESSGNPVLLCSMRKYNRYFAGLPASGFYRHLPVSRRALRIRRPFSFLRSGKFPPGEIHFNNPAVQYAEEAALMVLVGWRFRDTQALYQFGDLIRSIFRPAKIYSEIISDTVVEARAGADNLVGVHLRRGDYKSFRGGVFYYDNEYYAYIMSLVAKSLNGNTRFLVASDEPVHPALFPGLSVSVAPGQELEDLYCLALCDRIIGPPSTYSSWAAFYGDVPFWHFDNRCTGEADIDFRKVSGAK